MMSDTAPRGAGLLPVPTAPESAGEPDPVISAFEYRIGPIFLLAIFSPAIRRPMRTFRYSRSLRDGQADGRGQKRQRYLTPRPLNSCRATRLGGGVLQNPGGSDPREGGVGGPRGGRGPPPFPASEQE